jgi:hypothetical protein
MRPLYALPIILFFMLLPIGMFTGAFAQLTIALCGNPNDHGAQSDSWYCRWAPLVLQAPPPGFRTCVAGLPPGRTNNSNQLLYSPPWCVLPPFPDCSDDRWATFLRNTSTSLAPSIVLSIYHM